MNQPAPAQKQAANRSGSLVGRLLAQRWLG